MGLFDEIEKQVEKELEKPGTVDRLANEAEKAVGGKNSQYGKMIEEGKGLYGKAEGGKKRPQR